MSKAGRRDPGACPPFQKRRSKRGRERKEKGDKRNANNSNSHERVGTLEPLGLGLNLVAAAHLAPDLQKISSSLPP